MAETKPTEREWAKSIAERLDKELCGVRVKVQRKLAYTNEVVEYRESNHNSQQHCYTTDILVYQEVKDKYWKPRVVIETKLGRHSMQPAITTHDAIIYSQKAAEHKSVHPYLRYGIFVGNLPGSLPGRLFRHGTHFDFMLSWKKFEAAKHEWEVLKQILIKEIVYSKNSKKYFIPVAIHLERNTLFYISNLS